VALIVSDDHAGLRAAQRDPLEGSITSVLRWRASICVPAYKPMAKLPVKIENGMIWTRDDRI
jgi:hypothetical protein